MGITKYTLPKAINGGKSLVFKNGKVVEVNKKGTPIGNGWVVSCSIDGKQIKERVTNKISLTMQEVQAEALMETWLEMLEKGLHPKDKDDKKTMLGLNYVPTLVDKINEYKQYLTTTNISKEGQVKNISRLMKLTDTYNINGEEWSIADKELKEITTVEIETILNQLISKNIYAQSTLKIVKSMYNTFFQHYLKKREIEQNPLDFISKNIKSDKETEDVNEPFDDSHFSAIMDKIKEYPKFNLLCQFIYHTCARPREIRKLKVGSIQGNYLKFRADETKTKTKDEVLINDELRKIIDSMELDKADKNDYLFSNNMQNEDGKHVWGKHPLYVNYGSNFFRENILKPIGLYENTGYNLYSFKATSNCHKLLDGWSLIEIQRLNRHSSPSATERYIKKLAKYIKLDKKPNRTI